MPEPERIPVQSQDAPDATLRLARALGMDEARVESAFKALGMTPTQAFTLILHGTDEAKVERIAKELHVSRARLALALLDGATQSAAAWAQQPGGIGERVSQTASRAVDRAKEWGFEVAEFVLETFAETIPRILNRITLVLVLTGVVFAGMGILAIVSPALFLEVVVYVVGGLLIVFGAAAIWLAWKIHEATATLRTLARLAKKWRARYQSWQEKRDGAD
jgi:hypothetical protein